MVNALREINDGAPLSVALRPKTRVDQERLGQGLGSLLPEDPMLRVRKNHGTGDIVVAGKGGARTSRRGWECVAIRA